MLEQHRRKTRAIHQVKQWLDDGKIRYDMKGDISASFKATLQLTASYSLDIEVSEGTPDSLTLMTRAYLTPADQRAFSRLSDENKDSFLRAVRQSLFSLDVDHDFLPDGDFLQSISITKTIYFDGLMKDTFFRALLLLKRALGLLNLAYSEHLKFRSSSILPR